MNVLNGTWRCPGEIVMLVSDLSFECRSISGLRFTHVFRELNQVADRIAALGFPSVDVAWASDPQLLELIRLDAIGRTVSRA